MALHREIKRMAFQREKKGMAWLQEKKRMALPRKYCRASSQEYLRGVAMKVCHWFDTNFLTHLC